MSLEVKVPSVGESITEVTIANILKKEGEFVNQDEIICELESDKATFELSAPQAGIVHWNSAQGDSIPIGNLVCTIEGAEAKIPEVALKPIQSAIQSAPVGQVFEVKIPTVGESITQVTIASWTKKNGDLVNLNDILCEIESDKATFELPAEASGILQIKVEKGATVQIGTSIASILMGNTESTSPPKISDETVSKTDSGPEIKENLKAISSVTPLAAAILADKGIHPSTVAGSGEGGKITKGDALKADISKTVESGTVNTSAPDPKNVSGDRTSRREKLSSLRKTVARRLVAVKNETAMLTTFNEVDMKPIMDLRSKYKDKFKEKHAVGLGFMSFFTKAVCVALSEFKSVNAMIDGDEIIYNDFADISIAVSAPKGLVVPVVRNAERMNFAEIEKEILRLAGKARDNKLSIEEMTGGTFTITNGGVFGSMMSTPIINAPQSAILGMHNIVERPVVMNGEIVIRPIMYVALSYDHRIIDGRESVGFLVRVKQLLEDPLRLLLDV